MNSTLLIIIVVISTILLIGIVIYNSLISKKNQVKNALSGIDVQLKKRSDLVPNLISTVKGYMKHEQSLLEQVTKTRAEVAKQYGATPQRFTTENILAQLLGQVYAVVENYPQLKASDNFVKLQLQLQDVEEHIAAARRAYNGAVYTYNNAVQMFPSSIVATMMKYRPETMFDAPEEQISNVKYQ